MPLALYNGTHKLVWTHTCTYTVKYSTHTSIHTRQPFRRRYNVFFFQAHTHSHSWTLWAACAFLILGNPSLVLRSPPGVPPSTLQPWPHHSRPMLIQPLVALLSLSRQKQTPIFCVTGKQANHSTTTATNNNIMVDEVDILETVSGVWFHFPRMTLNMSWNNTSLLTFNAHYVCNRKGIVTLYAMPNPFLLNKICLHQYTVTE